MTDFLFFLVKTNLEAGAAIVAIALLRGPVRAVFRASIAYGLWLLVPAVVLAGLLPPQPVTPAPMQQIRLVIGQHMALAAPQLVTGGGSWLLVLAWAAGASAMALYLLKLQRDFHRAERAGLAGPAVTGFFVPRIVLPADFVARFSMPEQAAILAHEKAHLARQDGRINALVALLRCLCWFNPLVHVASAWLRRDQELACDAAALRSVSRLDYANALIRAQVPMAALPLGCGWPGAEHPLTERVTLLARPAPCAVRRWVGRGVVALVMASGGAAAWAQQQTDAVPVMGTPGRFGLTVTKRAGGDGPVFYLTISGAKLQENADGSSRLSNAVAMQFPYGTVEADDAAITRAGVVTLTQHVKLQYGEKVMRGDKLVFDSGTGQLQMDGKQMPSGMPAGRS
jgi:beta-lactamase regulating signal transducer with metallopeptidase domain